MTACMFTSLNVVRIAFSCCDCSRRSAMRARRRLIGTRCSGRPSSDSVGGATGAAAAWRARRRWRPGRRPGHAAIAAGAGHGSGVHALSARILAAAGEATPAAEVEAGTAAAGAAAAACGGAAAGPWRRRRPCRRCRCGQQLARGHGAAIALDDFSQHARGGAGTSSTTLSVSTSMRISSASTAAPGCFFQVSRVASETDSESWGRRRR